MTYYLTKTNPLVFTTQKAERVTEWMIQDMLELLLKREYEMYEPEEAKSNLQQWLQADQVFLGVLTPPSKEPSEKEVQAWVEDFLMSEAGSRLLSQVGHPLSQQEEPEPHLEEMTLSDLLESLTIASEWDSEGPSLHSQFSNPSSSEA